MAKVNVNELTKEQIEKAMACKTADELMKLAEAEGYEMTVEEAEAYMAELADFELDEEMLKTAAGGVCYDDCSKCHMHSHPLPPPYHCFVGDSMVAVPGGEKPIKELHVGDEVITLDTEGREIVGKVTEEAPVREEQIVEVVFSDGTVWSTTETQTIYLGHEKNYPVKDAKGKKAISRTGGEVTVTDVKLTDSRETVYDVLIGEEEDEDVIFVAGIAAEGYFTKGERGL